MIQIKSLHSVFINGKRFARLRAIDNETHEVIERRVRIPEIAFRGMRSQSAIKHRCDLWAKKWGKDLIAEMSAGPDGARTIADFRDVFLNANLHLAEASIEKYMCLYDRIAVELPQAIESITQTQITHYCSQKLRTNGGVGYVFLLKKIGELALDADLISKPWKLLKAKPKKKIRRYLTDEQLEAFLEDAQKKGRKKTTYTIALVLAETGLRAGEVGGLEWRHVNLEERSIMVMHQAQNRAHGTIPLKNKSQRKIYMTQRLCDHLMFLPKNHKNVIPNQTAARVSRTMSEMMSSIFGIEGGAHILRHTYAMRLLALGRPIQDIQYCLGHADVSTTMQYLHLDASSSQRAARDLDGVRPIEKGLRLVK